MELAIQVQISNKVVYVSLCTNAIEEDMNPSVLHLPPAKNKY